MLFQIPQRYRFSSKSQHALGYELTPKGCFRYHKGTDFQANHNSSVLFLLSQLVVLDTTKVQIFKQITTEHDTDTQRFALFQIPQRYRFSSKSQRNSMRSKVFHSCFRYHKGTDFQANHNTKRHEQHTEHVVLDTTKVQIFKQITTESLCPINPLTLFQIPQRYRFSSKSQRVVWPCLVSNRCFRYHKGTDFQANHNH